MVHLHHSGCTVPQVQLSFQQGMHPLRLLPENSLGSDWSYLLEKRVNVNKANTEQYTHPCLSDGEGAFRTCNMFPVTARIVIVGVPYIEHDLNAHNTLNQSLVGSCGPTWPLMSLPDMGGPG